MRQTLLVCSSLSIVLLALSCVRSSKEPVPNYAEQRWYASAREVPALQLKYEHVLDVLPKSEAMRKRLCFGFDAQQTQDYDKVRQVFCQGEAPLITSLRDLQSALGLAIPESIPVGRASNGKPGLSPAWTLTGQSTSLVNRLVSPINPRVIVSTAPKDYLSPSADFVIMGFVRGHQLVEIIAKEPKTGGLKFFMVAFTQACNEQDACSTGHLQSSSIERNWQSITIYEDSHLVNTVFDCTHCHQPEGPGSEKILRLQENQKPWTHFFRSDTDGQELIRIFQEFHGTEESIGGVPAHLVSSSDPEKLASLLHANGFGEQPNSFPSDIVAQEVARQQLPGKQWLRGWENFLRGAAIPFPSWKISILDKDKYADVKANWQRVMAAGLAPEQLPDLFTAVDDRLAPSFGARAPQNASAQELMALACQRCHNKKLDANLGKSQFRADQTQAERSDFNAKNAIARLKLLQQDPANPLAMPPRLFMDLTEAEIDLLIQELKSGKNLP